MMKFRTVLLLSCLGAPLSAASAYLLTPAPLAMAAPEPVARAEPARPPAEAAQAPGARAPSSEPAAQPPSSRLSVDGAVRFEAMLAHERLPSAQATETHVLVTLRGDDKAPSQRLPAHMALVLDRSGSMAGGRMHDAIEAAVQATKMLRDGDMVSVVTFDDNARVDVQPTVLEGTSRPQVEATLRALRVGGDTCMSCGIEAAELLLGQTPDRLRRVLLLGDGEANRGVREPEGFRKIAAQAREQGVAISTVGVGAQYNEKILAALSIESNGRHHYAQDDASLAAIFQAEAEALMGAVASDAVLELKLPEGVELTKIYERAFSREGSTVRISLGAVARGEVKPVLASIKLPAGSQGQAIEAKLSYREQGRDRSATGSLAATAAPEASPLRPEVARWLVSAQTIDTIRSANDLFSHGKASEAASRLDARTRSVEAELGTLRGSGALPDDVEKAFATQLASLRDASRRYQAAAAAPRAGHAPAPAADPAKRAYARAIRDAGF